MNSIFTKQLKVLLWKNFRLKKRKPITLISEILVPLLIIIIIVPVRNSIFKFKMDHCEFKEKSMASMGFVPFILDFFCTFNTTCYNKTQINWNENYSSIYAFKMFTKNLYNVYQTLPKEKLTVNSLITWATNHKFEIDQLISNIMPIIKLLSPLIASLKEADTENLTASKPIIIQIFKVFCGSDENDFTEFYYKFSSISTKNVSGQTNAGSQFMNESNVTCERNFENFFGNSNIFDTISSWVFGKIYFSPNSPLTREIMRRANITFETLDYIRLASIEWRLHFRDWINEAVNNSKLINELKSCKSWYFYFDNNLCETVNAVLNFQTIQSILNKITLMFSFLEKTLNCTELNKFVPINESITVENFIKQPIKSVFAVLVINDTFRYLTPSNATFLNYQIRIPESRIDSTKHFKVTDKFWTAEPRRETLRDFKYYTSGFLLLQEAIDRAFIEIVTNNETIDVGSSMQIMPYPCYVDDMFIRFITNMMPFMLVIAWVPSVTGLIKSIVYEKERRLKEFMRVMGLGNSVHWIGWFLSTVVVLIFPVTIMSLLLIYSSILSFSCFAVVFLVLLLYVVSFICQVFMISLFFNNANLASVAGGVIYFILYMPFVVFIRMQSDLSTGFYYLGGLSAQVAFCNAINFIGYWEQSTEGAHFGNLFDGAIIDLKFGVGHCMLMLIVDSVLYLSVAWYVESVFPGQYGVGKAWYFLFTRNYWRAKENISLAHDINNSAPLIIDYDSEGNFENEYTDLRVGISIRNLVKTYPGAKTRAVDNLNLNFYQSQITAFLGHNGAGKTTTISILTGIFSPSSGTAYILNEDIRSDMDKIREKMGLCPQHNILFSNLTVEDHIYFYGLLKGMKVKEIRQVLPIIIKDVGLTAKVNTLSKKLSGGMKRKLSLALAFIGDPSIVFLDEPTAGVDPFARRGIWDLLIKYRNDERTIILTTHQMDEADYLSDRIAIISQGKLQCCGSSVFLKRKFGDGYRLILVKNFNAQKENFRKGISNSGDKLLQFIKSHIPDAKMETETMTQWSFVLPQNDSNSCKFSGLFVNLDEEIDNLNALSYGLSDTSLEEVFIRVADDPAKINEETKNEKLIPDNLNRIAVYGDIENQEPFLDLEDLNQQAFVDKSLISLNFNRNHKLLTGFPLLKQQIIGLQIKRFHYAKRNKKGIFAELILPILMITLMIALLKLVNPLESLPAMEISPWLMMPKSRSINLNTFYRKENQLNFSITNQLGNKNSINPLTDRLESEYRSDLGESGIRCMNPSIYRSTHYRCFPEYKNNKWSPIPNGNIPLISPECDCNATGYQICNDPRSGGPPNSYRIMTSSDKLNNLTGYNISDYLLKNFRKLSRKLYGGFQFVLPSTFGWSSKLIGDSPFWEELRDFVNASQANHNQSNLNSLKFIDYLQKTFKIYGIKTSFTRIWANSKGYVSMPAYANIFSNLLLRSRLNKSAVKFIDYGISVSNFPIKMEQSNKFLDLVIQMILEMSLAIFVIFGLSFIPASFVIFLVEERVSGSKRQQFVSGINPYVYWVSNFLWDIMKYIIPIIIIIIIFIAFDYQSYIGSKNALAFILLLIFYGLAIIPHMYPFSFFISTPSTAFVVLNVYNLLVGTITTISTFILDILEVNYEYLKEINDILKKVFLIFPQFNLGRGIMDLFFNYFYNSNAMVEHEYNALQWDIAGEKLFSLFSLSIGWWIVLIIIESGIVNRIICGKLKNSYLKRIEIRNTEDFDVNLERERMSSDQKSDDVLRVINLTKIYNVYLKFKDNCGEKGKDNYIRNKAREVAVNNLCFGVREGECFGLLGVNGAGKTTTFKMLTGEEEITHGNAFINGQSIISDMIGAHRNMGFCPQFDALHALLTCEEQLTFYCRIRGIESNQIKSVVDTSLRNLSLTPHATKLTQNLSGGNKRKLSTAIALIGNPKVIFLDEPTSGMDAGARRFLWNVIQKMTNENKIAVILTSHNMEECEALCHRLSIMVNGEMKCLGSVQHLKSKFGDNYYVKIHLYSRKCQISHRLEVKLAIEKNFRSGISIKDENFLTLLYTFDLSFIKLSDIFTFFHKMKVDGLIIDFTVYQTSLDEIFIDCVKDKVLLTIPYENPEFTLSPLTENDIVCSFEESQGQVTFA